MRAQLVQIKEALEKQLAELDQLGSKPEGDGQGTTLQSPEGRDTEGQDVEKGSSPDGNGI
jgi:hypothetical protein